MEMTSVVLRAAPEAGRVGRQQRGDGGVEKRSVVEGSILAFGDRDFVARAFRQI